MWGINACVFFIFLLQTQQLYSLGIYVHSYVSTDNPPITR